MREPYAIAARRLFGLLTTAFLLAGCASLREPAAPDYAAIVAAPERSAADRQIDLRRKPAELLAFTGVMPGMRVLDLGAGGGYSSELLARAVGPGGVVYAQDSPSAVARLKGSFERRSRSPAMKNVVRVLRPYEDPLPPGVTGLDLETFFFAYHDTVYAGVDRARMDRSLYAALKPGGMLVIADHSARAGAGLTVTHSLHRIEEGVLRREVEAAGFRLVAEGEFLRHPEDPRDAPVFHSKVPVDEFVLRFEKPR